MSAQPTLLTPTLAVALTGLLLGSVGSAFAVAFDTDLVATGAVDIVDDFYSIADNAGYNADLTLRAGGAPAVASFSESSSPPFAPATQVLTDFGDGIGFGINGTAAGASAQDSFLPVDFSLDLHNSSGTHRLTVLLKIAVSQNQASTNTDDDSQEGGTTGELDAFTESELILFDEDNVELFISSVISDTVLGDFLRTTPESDNNELSPATYGASVSDSREETLAILLDPGMSFLLEGIYDLFWGSFTDASSTSSSHESFISIVGVTSEPIPSPGTLLLAALGLAAGGVVRQRSSRM